ncbi:MAG: hypothetical protein LKCHEGNO_01535 [Burkholderiaceae bacterium]|nr:hypothetical protein [Burkholderiaceae bacterium]
MNRLAGFAVAYGASAVLQKGIGFALFLWLAHSLPVGEYARFGLLYALQSGLAAVAGAGIIEAVMGLLRETENPISRQRLFAGANAVFALLATASVALIAFAASKLLARTQASGVELGLVAAVGLLSAFATFQSHLTRLEEDHPASLAMGLLPALAGWLGGLVGFAVSHSVSAFFSGLAFGLIVALIVLRLVRVGIYGVSARREHTGPILARIAPFVGVAILGWLSGYGNTYLIDAVLSTVDVARFTFAYTLASIMHLVATSLNQVWSPRFLRIIRVLPFYELEARNRRFFALQGTILGLIGAVSLALAPWLIGLGGPRLAAYRDLQIELLLLFVGYAVMIPWYHVQNYYFAEGKGKELLGVSLTASAIGMLTWLGAMWLLGSTGVYVGFLALMAARMLGTLVRARIEWGVRILWEGPALAIALLSVGCLASIHP